MSMFCLDGHIGLQTFCRFCSLVFIQSCVCRQRCKNDPASGFIYRSSIIHDQPNYHRTFFLRYSSVLYRMPLYIFYCLCFCFVLNISIEDKRCQHLVFIVHLSANKIIFNTESLRSCVYSSLLLEYFCLFKWNKHHDKFYYKKLYSTRNKISKMTENTFLKIFDMTLLYSNILQFIIQNTNNTTVNITHQCVFGVWNIKLTSHVCWWLAESFHHVLVYDIITLVFTLTCLFSFL